MSLNMSRLLGYAQKFRDEHKSKTDSQLRKMRDELLQELEELADAEEFHSFQYAEANWEFDMTELLLKERKQAA